MQMFKCRWDSENEVKIIFKKAEFKKQKNGIYNLMEFYYPMLTSKDFKMLQLPIHTVCNRFALLLLYCYLCLERPS